MIITYGASRSDRRHVHDHRAGLPDPVVPQSFTYTHAGFKQVNAETEDAARSLGASWG